MIHFYITQKEKNSPSMYFKRNLYMEEERPQRQKERELMESQ